MDILFKAPENKEIIRRLKSSAKKRGIYFDLSSTDIDEIGWPITCPVLGMPLKWHKGEPRDDSFSFDRKNSSLGYVKDNLEIMSVLANRAKNNLTIEELKKFSQYFG